MTTRTPFAFRIDMWREHRAHRWRGGFAGCSGDLPDCGRSLAGCSITLRQGARASERKVPPAPPRRLMIR